MTIRCITNIRETRPFHRSSPGLHRSSTGGLYYSECFISDQSSLADFGLDTGETLQKINETYDLQLKELGDGNIVELLTLIEAK